MRIRIPVALYMFTMATIELSLGGRAMRTDLGSFISVFRRKPWLMLYIPPVVIFTFVMSGIPGVVSAILIATPFAALSFGRSLIHEDIKALEKFFYALLGLGLVQWLVGNSLLPGFLYSEGRKNALPHSILASEPSFALDALFALSMLLLVHFKGRRAWAPVLLLMAFGFASSVLTVVQNGLLVMMTVGFCLLRASKSRAVLFIFAITPTVLCYMFPFEGKLVGLFFLSEFKSWRQIANIVATSDAGWIELLFTDYRALVSGSLLGAGYYNLYDWIESAFSWFPFLHSIGGRLLAIGMFILLLLQFPKIHRLTLAERSVLYGCMLIFLYTAPKWQFFSVITMGGILRIATERNHAAETAAATEDSMPEVSAVRRPDSREKASPAWVIGKTRGIMICGLFRAASPIFRRTLVRDIEYDWSTSW